MTFDGLKDILQSFEDNSEKAFIEEELFSLYRKQSPLAAYNKIPFKFDEKGNLLNREVATEATKFGKELLNIRPDLGEHLIIANLPNGVSKSFSMAYTLALVLTDSHPTIDLKGIPGDIWLLTNSNLLKTEYPKIFFDDPAILGSREDTKKPEGSTILLPDGSTCNIRATYTNDGILETIENKTNGKKIRCFSYQQNEQIFAGQNPISCFVDESGEKTKKRNAANTLTLAKMNEIISRIGRNGRCKGKFVIVMAFTFIFEDWIRQIIRKIRQGKFIVPLIHPTRTCAKLIEGITSADNPYLNREQQAFARVFFELTDQFDEIKKRQDGNDLEDPLSVFPEYNRPYKMTIEEVELIKARAKKESGWLFLEGIDPGLRDYCSVLFCLAHPLEGLFLVDEIAEPSLTLDEIAFKIKQKENLLGFPMKVTRIFDPNHIKKTTQEQGMSNLQRWQQVQIHGIPCPVRDRSYDSIFTMIKKNLLKYSPVCTRLDKEIENHKKDEFGRPLDKGGDDAIDSMRYLVNWYHFHYWNKYHAIDEETGQDVMPQWKKEFELAKQEALAMRAAQANQNNNNLVLFGSAIPFDSFDTTDYFSF